MAALVFGAIGALAAPAGYASLGWTIGSTLGNLLFPGSLPDQVIEGPRISDLKVQTSTYGQAIPKVWGTDRVTGNVIWSRAVDEHAVTTTTTSGGGGKGGGPSQTTVQTTYTYTQDLAISIHDSPIVGIRKIWANGELVYTVADDAGSASIAASALKARAITVYLGSETQGADPLIASYIGAARTPAYLGTAYVVIEATELIKANWEFEIVTAGTVADLAVPAVWTLAATDGSGSVVLGRAGQVWAGAGPINATRWSFYSGGRLSVYQPPIFEYIPVGVTKQGEAIATGFGSTLTILREDGQAARYSGSVSLAGGNGIEAENDTTLWCRGDSSVGTNFHRVVLGSTTFSATKIGVDAFLLARKACAIGARCYIHASVSGGQKYLGYVNTTSLSWVPLVAMNAVTGILVASDGTLWVGPSPGSTSLLHYSADGALLATITLPESAAWKPYEDAQGNIWVVGSPSNQRAYRVHPITGAVTGKTAFFTGQLLGFTEDNRAVLWDTVAGNYTLKEIEPLGRITVGTVQLSTVVSDICKDAGLAAGDIEVSALTDTVDGYARTRVMSARAALEPLMLVYQWDAVESDLKVKCVKRGGAIAAVIPEDELAAHIDGEEMPAQADITRALETELPYEVRVLYPNKESAFQQDKQYARRLVGASRNPVTIEVPIVMSASRAVQAAHAALFERWSARMRAAFSVTRRYADLEPSDVVQITKGGLVYTVRITRKDEARGLIKFQGVTEDAAVYPQSQASTAYTPVTASVAGAGITAVRLLDIPILREADNDAGFYAVAAGYNTDWRGAELWKSTDSGSSYGRTDTAFLLANVLGNALTALPNFSGGNVWDKHSTVDVQVIGGTLAGDSDLNVLNGANLAYLGGELIHFTTAALISAGKYRLSGLLRGRRGTEQFMGTHAVGDLFVLFNATTTKRVSATSGEVGLARKYKAVGIGQVLAEAAAIDFTNTAAGLKPLSPAQLGGGRNAAGDVVVNWTRRTRAGGEWRDYVDASLSEASEAYEVEVWTSGYATLKRTFTGLGTPTVTYTAAQQATDFGSNQATVYLRVFQISAVVGRGFKLEGTV